MNVLVTGGCGYIGSHACVALILAGHEVSVIDDLSNSRVEVLDRVAAIAGRRPSFFQGDVRDQNLLRRAFANGQIAAVFHFAGLKAVGESVAQPLRYYDCNVGGAISLCHAMTEARVRTLIFSSSATVYGDPASVPISEGFPRSATNPYGASKLMIEDNPRGPVRCRRRLAGCSAALLQPGWGARERPDRRGTQRRSQ